jgi:subtilisin family serine protease
MAFLACNSNAFAEPPDHVPGQLLVKVKPFVPEREKQAIFSGYGARQHGVIPQLDVRILKVPEARQSQVLLRLRQNQHVAWAEPDYLVEPALVPNDPYYSLEWHLPKIQAPQAWDLTTGAPGIIIAILDSGIDAAHPDLAGSLVPGWNFYDNNADTSDVTGHGTPVAGTAAGLGNNGVGVAPLAWGCKLMPVRICDTNGYASLSTIASGLTWAADQGARVANISFRASSGSAITSAAQYFQSKGGVVTVSAGNNGIFDTSADNPYLLTVSATDQNDLLASWSNTGSNIDLCAPGVNIMTMAAGGDYGSGSGTSFSAPVVAGVAALVLSANPGLTGTQAQNILKQTADDLGTPGWDTSYGWGRVNALKAVQAALSAGLPDTNPPAVQITAPASGSVLSGDVVIDVSASDTVGVARVELYLNGTGVATNASAPAAFSWNTLAYANGSYTLKALAYDTVGNVGTSALIPITVQNADTVAPIATIAAPANGSTVSGAVSVSINATDNVAVAKVEWYLDGVLAGTSASPAPVFSWATTNAANGSHTLQAKAYDAAGNTGTSGLATVTVQNAVPDTRPPTVKITSPTNGATLGKTTSVSVVASDNVGVTKVNLLVDGKLFQSSSSSNPVFSWNTSKVARGSHTLQSVAYDAAGNSTRSSIVTVYK